MRGKKCLQNFSISSSGQEDKKSKKYWQMDRHGEGHEKVCLFFDTLPLSELWRPPNEMTNLDKWGRKWVSTRTKRTKGETKKAVNEEKKMEREAESFSASLFPVLLQLPPSRLNTLSYTLCQKFWALLMVSCTSPMDFSLSLHHARRKLLFCCCRMWLMCLLLCS